MGARDLLDRAIARSGIGRLALTRTQSRLRILCYHGIWAAPGPHFGNKLFMSPEKFEARLALIKSLGLEVMPMREAVLALRKGRLPPRAAVITIDDGWATTFSHMLPALERCGFPATIYVQTARIEARSPVADVALRYAFEHTSMKAMSLSGMAFGTSSGLASLSVEHEGDKARVYGMLEELFASTPLREHRALLEKVFQRLGVDMEPLARCKAFDLCDESALVEADAKGFEIALHTHTHGLGDFSVERVTAEIEQNRASLARILGRPSDTFRHFCWPSGEYTPQAVSHVQATGIDLATSCELDLASAESNPLLLPRILDGQGTTDEGFLVAVSGLQTSVDRASAFIRGR
jgi:peptidoglycan/xylan/chitin deacetylase (PgdA/CDA1 family)